MKFLLTIITSLFVFTATAQDVPKPPENVTSSDEKSKAILEKVSKKYKTYTSTKTKFSLLIESPDNELSETQGGTVYLSGNKYRLDFGGQEVICDDKTIWTLIKGTPTEVQINNYEPDPNTITPSQLFTIWQEGFYSLLIEEKTVKGIAVSIIDLTPNDKEKPFFKIRMVVNKADNTVLQTKVFDKNGNRYTYEVVEFVANPKLATDFFSFQADGETEYDIIDLRE